MASDINQMFGVPMGARLKDIAAKKNKKSDTVYDLKTVPAPHPLLKEYSVTATPEDGVCSIVGSTGLLTQEKASRVASTIISQLTDAYGEPVVPASMYGMWKWTTDGDIKIIGVSRLLPMYDKSAVFVSATYTNYDECQKIKMENPFKSD
ncbi:hypothetical protein [Ancylobacter sp. FA202]|uniref:hypothetical protein n=1 Tax=Ancylobacter sp. FA202 TaxID=1111106 RepID=UPI0012DE69D9|nr:hypothetical protein [Ancylobacter sp. FA202]